MSQLMKGKVPGTINLGLPIAVTATPDGTAGIVQVTQAAGGPAGAAYTTGTPTSANVSTVTSVMLAANAARKYAVLVNTGVAWVYLAIGTPAVAGSGIALAPNGGSYEMLPGSLATGAINGITSTGTSTVSVLEGA